MKKSLLCLTALFIFLCGLPGSYLCQTAEGLLAKNDPDSVYAKETSEFPEVAKMIDCYKAKSMDEEGGRLDDLIIGLQNDPTAMGYIIRYRGSKTTLTKFNARKVRIKEFLLK